MSRLKQWISALSMMAVLLCAVAPVLGTIHVVADEAEQYVITFDSADKCQNGTVDNVTFTYSGNATPSYDETEGALLMATTGTNAYINANVAGLNVSADTYPVLAYRIRVKEANANADLRLQLLASTDKSNASAGPSNYNNLISGKTADWQTYTCDFSQSTDSTNLNNLGANAKFWQGGDYAGSVWNNVAFNFPSWRSNMHLPYYVEWMGFFKTTADAKAYTPPSEEEPKEQHIIAFDGTDKCQNGTADGVTFTYSGNATPSYDFASDTLLMATTGTNAYIITNVSKLKISAEEYPVLAYRIRIKEAKNDADLRLQLLASTDKSNASAGPSNYNNLISGKTADWQTYICDFSQSTDSTNLNNLGADARFWQGGDYAGSVWNNVAFNFPSWRSNMHLPYYVEWMGFFKSEEAANSYVHIKPSADRPIYYFDEAEKVKTGSTADGIQLSTEQASISFDEESKSMKVVTTGVANQGIALNVAAKSISAAKYPIVAYRVRLAQTPAENVTYRSHVIGATSAGGAVSPSSWSYHTFYADEVRDTVIWNFADSGVDVPADGKAGMGEGAKYWTEATYSDNQWTSVTLYLPNYRSAGTSLTYYIDWIGFFEDKESAIALGKSDEPEDTRDAPDKVVVFDQAEKCVTGKTVDGVKLNTENAAVSYDVKANALKVTTAESATNRGIMLNISDKKLSTFDYPILAYKIRLATAFDAETQMRTYPIVTTAASGGTKLSPSTWCYHKFAAGATDATMIWNMADSGTDVAANGISGMGANASYWTDKRANHGNTWKEAMLFLPSYRHQDTAPLTYYVEWVGFFATREAAESYRPMSNTKQKIITFDTAEKTVAGGTVDGVGLSIEKVETSFDEASKSMLVTDKGGPLTNRGINLDVKALNLSTIRLPIVAIQIRLKEAPTKDTMYRAYPMAETSQSGNQKLNPNTWSYHSFAAGRTKAVMSYNFADSSSDLNAAGKTGMGAFAKYWADAEAHASNLWNRLYFFLPNYREAQTLDYYIEWIGFFESQEALDEYRGIVRKEGALFYDLSDPDIMEEIGYIGYDSQVAYDEKEKATKIMAAENSGDASLTTNVAGFSLGESANSEVFTISDTKKYPVLAVRLKLKNPQVQSGWFNFRTSESAAEYPIARPAYQETDQWQTVALNCLTDGTMGNLFSGQWTGMTIALAASSVTEPGETFYVKWVGVFKSIEAAYAYTGEKPPVKQEEPEEEPEEAPEEEKVIKPGPVVEKPTEEEPAEEEPAEPTWDQFIRIKAAAASVISIENGKVICKKRMTAGHLTTAFAMAEGIKLIVENEDGKILKDDTVVMSGYRLVIIKDDTAVLSLSIEAPAKTLVPPVGSNFFTENWIWLVCLSAAVVIGSAAIGVILWQKKKHLSHPIQNTGGF